jgi:hypothetical protein
VPVPEQEQSRLARVFISHSSHGDAAKDRLAKLVAALEEGAGKVEVSYDSEQIEDGSRWRDVIDAMLVDCDAAVVLVSSDALKSAWVLKEATLLRARYEAEYNKLAKRPGFPLLPVLFDGITTDQLKDHVLWHPLELEAIQFIVGGTPDAIAKRIKCRLDELGESLRTPLERLAADVAAQLSQPSRALRLEDAVTGLGIPVPPYVTARAERLAYAIARWAIARRPPALEDIAVALGQLGGTFPAEDARLIFETVRPLWVEVDAASWLLRASWRQPDVRDVALACTKPCETVPDYTARAVMPRRPPQFVPLNNVTGGRQVEDIQEELHSELRSRFNSLRNLEAEELDAFLANKARHFCIGLTLPDDDVVAELQTTYPAPTFIFYVDSADRPLPAGVALVEPPLDPELERRVLDDRQVAYTMFGL